MEKLMPNKPKFHRKDAERLTPLQKKRITSILEVAHAYFVEKGISDSKMEEIAERIGVSRQTLYRYYRTKEDLAYAVEVHVLNNLLRCMSQLFTEAQELSLDELEQRIEELTVAFLEEHEQEIKFTALFDSFFSTYPGNEFSDIIQNTVKTYPNPFTNIIEREQHLGTVCDTMDPYIAGEMITHSMLALSQRVVNRREALTQEYGFNPLKLVPMQMKFFIRGLRCSTPEDC